MYASVDRLQLKARMPRWKITASQVLSFGNVGIHGQKYASRRSAKKVTVYRAGFAYARPPWLKPSTGQSCCSLEQKYELRACVHMLWIGRVWRITRKLHGLSIGAAE